MHRSTKHIAIRHFYIRELVSEDELKVQYVPTEYQYADILTKAMHKPRLAVISPINKTKRADFKRGFASIYDLMSNNDCQTINKLLFIYFIDPKMLNLTGSCSSKRF